MDIIDLYNRVSAQAEALVRSIPDDRLGFATPCSEWDVKALCNHIYAGDIIVSTRIRNEPLPDPKSTEDRLGDDPKGKIAAAFADLRGQLAEPGILDQTVITSRDGVDYQRELAGLVDRRVADLVVHIWDLEKALDLPTDDFDPEIVAWTLDHFQTRFEGYERTAPQILASVAEEKSLPADATGADRLAAFMGRDVEFTPGPFVAPVG
jgi:uncharacterized protein (TIGR03086 family)